MGDFRSPWDDITQEQMDATTRVNDAGLVRCVEMPCCGFTMGASHVNDGDGNYTCPQCSRTFLPLKEADRG